MLLSPSNFSSERWSNKETTDFLDLCKKHQIIQKMKNSKYRFDELFYEIKIDLEKLGYRKTIHQMSIKLKKLRNRYKESLDNQKLSDNFQFFNKMFELENNIKNEEKSSSSSSTSTISNNIFQNNENNIITQTLDNNEIKNNIMFTHSYSKPSKFFNDDIQLNSDDLYDDEIAYRIRSTITDHTYDLPFSAYDDFINYNLNQNHQNHNDENNPQKYLQLKNVETNTNENKRKHNNCDNNEDDVTTTDEIENGSKKKKRTKDIDETLKDFVTSYKKAQEDLQKSFFKEQLELQKQQQEWEEKMFDQERAFFLKMFKPLIQQNNP